MAVPTARAAANMEPTAHRSLSGSPQFEPLAEQAHHALGERQIAGGEERKEALARLLQNVHLAESGDAVDAGIGAGI